MEKNQNGVNKLTVGALGNFRRKNAGTPTIEEDRWVRVVCYASEV